MIIYKKLLTFGLISFGLVGNIMRILILILLFFSAPRVFSFDGELTQLTYLKQARDNFSSINTRFVYLDNKEKIIRDNFHTRILSWIFYLDSSPEVPLYSESFFNYLTQYPSCQKRLLLEILNEELAIIPKYLRAPLLADIFINSNSPKSLSVNNIASFKPFIFKGTQTQKLRKYNRKNRIGQLSQAMMNNLNYLSTIFSNKLFIDQLNLQNIKNVPIPKSNLSAAFACSQNFNIEELFPWWDFSDLKQYINTSEPVAETTDNLINIFKTSPMPLTYKTEDQYAFSPHLQTIAQSPYLKLTPGSNFNHPSNNFVQAFFKAIPEIAYYDGNQLTKDSCQILAGALSWGSLLGLQVNATSYEKYGINEKLFVKWMKLTTSLYISNLNKNHPAFKNCVLAYNFATLIWGGNTSFPSLFSSITLISGLDSAPLLVKYTNVDDEMLLHYALDHELFKEWLLIRNWTAPFNILSLIDFTRFFKDYDMINRFVIKAKFEPYWEVKLKFDQKIYTNQDGEKYIKQAETYWWR